MKVWITKYALTEGIIETDGKVVEQNKNMLRVFDGSFESQYYHGEGRDWHTTKDSAKSRARLMRDKKIKSLEKKLTKLKDLTF